MRVSYFPGCTLNTTGKGFDDAVRASSAAVGLELVELPEWNCCGATYPLIIDNMLELAAPAHVLVSARDEGTTVTTACTTCYNVLKRTNKYIREHEEERERINAFIENLAHKRLGVGHFGKAVRRHGIPEQSIVLNELFRALNLGDVLEIVLGFARDDGLLRCRLQRAIKISGDEAEAGDGGQHER